MRIDDDLINKVLGKGVHMIQQYTESIRYEDENGDIKELSIEEFFFTVKKWFCERGVSLTFLKWQGVFVNLAYIEQTGTFHFDDKIDTDKEDCKQAIFDAAIWVLKNKTLHEPDGCKDCPDH